MKKFVKIGDVITNNITKSVKLFQKGEEGEEKGEIAV